MRELILGCLLMSIAALGSALAADTAPAKAELGTRIILDASQISDADWTTAEGASCTGQAGAVTVKSGTLASAWAAPKAAVPAPDGATLKMDLAEIKNGKVTVQAEWFSAEGVFIAATNAFEGLAAPTKKESAIAQLKPKDHPEASRIRLKLWTEGADTEARFATLSIVGPRQWKTRNVQLVKDFLDKPKLETDKGITADASPGRVDLTLEPGTPYAGAAFTARTDVSPQGVLLVDVATISGGGMAVQLVFFDKDGKYLNSLELVKDLNTPGPVEVPLKIYRSRLPEGAATCTCKLWLSGKQARARISGVFFGVADK